LFLVNQTSRRFPIGRLRLSDDRSTVNGVEWGIDSLAEGECVSVWRPGGNPRPPNEVTCSQVGETVRREGPDRFWRSPFNVYYDDELVSRCSENRCEITVTLNP
jgi:hypothetical protein